MPIYRLLQNQAFGPDQITLLTTAFEDALSKLQLVNRTDPIAESLAKKIIELAQQGERDPIRLRDRALQSLSG
jgi:hypothetical protein